VAFDMQRDGEHEHTVPKECRSFVGVFTGGCPRIPRGTSAVCGVCRRGTPTAIVSMGPSVAGQRVRLRGATAVLAARNQVPCRSRRMTSEKALSDGRLDPRRQATRLSVWPMASDDNAATSARLALHLIQPPLNSKTKTTISNIRPRPPP